MIDSLILFIIIINNKIKNKNNTSKRNIKKVIKCRFKYSVTDYYLSILKLKHDKF